MQLALHLSPADDVGVVDEVQMMQDISRGGAWTRAILGEPVTATLAVGGVPQKNTVLLECSYVHMYCNQGGGENADWGKAGGAGL